MMKSFTILAASALLGSAAAEVHKLKLNKVPLSEQLVRSSHHPYCLHNTLEADRLIGHTQHRCSYAQLGPEVHGNSSREAPGPVP